MKTLKLFGMTIVMVLLAVNFAACSSDDDEDNSSYATAIVGTWTIVCDEGWEVDENGEKDSWKDEDATHFLKFYNDGTGTHADDRDYDPYTWNITDNTLVLRSKSGHNEKEIYTISIRNNTMILEGSTKDFYNKLTCKKK